MKAAAILRSSVDVRCAMAEPIAEPLFAAEVGALGAAASATLSVRPAPARSWFHRPYVLMRKTGIVLDTLVTDRRLILHVLTARDGAEVRAELRRQPMLLSFLAVPFLSSGWDSSTRLARIVGHCGVASRLGSPFVGPKDSVRPICDLPGLLEGYRLTICTPPEMLREGLLTLAIADATRRIFSLSFIFAEEEGGIVAYVGAVQGSATDDAGETYRSFTKEACGVRPRDFIIEAFRLLCCAIGVRWIYGVSTECRHQRSAYFEIGATDYDKVKLDYNEAWLERGGTLEPGGFFRLAPRAVPRSHDSIPARKRALYRRRGEMWAEIEALVGEGLGKVQRAAGEAGTDRA
jgi:uncharacterized protein VirK/YbjX